VYISLDVLLRLGQIALIIAGVIAIIYLVLLFKSLIGTLTTAQKTLDALTKDLEKLQGPLETVDQLSNTVSEVQGSAKKAAISAADAISAAAGSIKDKYRKKDQEQENQNPQPEEEPKEKVHWVKIENETIPQDGTKPETETIEVIEETAQTEGDLEND
jgi:small-conductance mechanosensitive channel